MKNKRVIAYLCIFILLLSGCASSKRKERQAQKLFYQMFEEKLQDSILGQLELSCGGKLYVSNTKLGENEKYFYFDSDKLHLLLQWLDCWMEGKELVTSNITYDWLGRQVDPESSEGTSVPIFWQSDPDGTQSDAAEYDSNFFYIDGRLGRDVIVIVTPAREKELTAYSECAEYGVEPYDSLDSVPMKVVDETRGKAFNELWHYGYPVWVFAVPYSEIDRSYELHFGDYVLTGKDIRSGTWSPGN